jgi:uncharacterized protein (DUF1697 family)
MAWVALLRGVNVSGDDRLPMADLRRKPEKAILAGRVVYLHMPHGHGRTKLNNAYFEKALGMPATTRNWRTVLALAAMASER